MPIPLPGTDAANFFRLEEMLLDGVAAVDGPGAFVCGSGDEGMVTAQGSPDGTVRIDTGGVAYSAQGLRVAFDASSSVGAFSAPGIGLERRDIVVVTWTPNTAFSLRVADVHYEVRTGLAVSTGTSTDPALGPFDIALARVFLAGTDAIVNTGDITDIRKHSASVSGASILDGSLPISKLEDLSANVVLGRSSTSGPVTEIAFTAAAQDLTDDATPRDQRSTLGVPPAPSGVTTADSSSIASTTTETAFSQAGTIVGSGNAAGVVAGQVFDLEASGVLDCTASPTIHFRIRFGGVSGVLLADLGAMTVASSGTGFAWRVRARITFRTIGASASIVCNAEAMVSTGAGTASISIASAGPVSGDTTPSSTALGVTAQWSASSGSNTAKQTQFAQTPVTN